MVYKYKLSDTLAFGKYKHKTLRYVIDCDAKYVEWLKTNRRDIFEIDKVSTDYLIEKLVFNTLVYVKLKVKENRFKNNFYKRKI